jgi:hypothetical protein
MSEADWSRIDDYSFVKLVGELLTRLGFVDIDYQGDGPDGGVDLFATELLPFTVQGRTPFRWAIQCKFSNKGSAASVNDAEIKDVEGILRSERYQAQDPRGYMLVTNRKIVQNVIERLRGIDRRSHYRTARVDGSHLQSMLDDNSQVIERFFKKRNYGPYEFGKPSVIVSPPAGGSIFSQPSISIEVQNPSGTRSLKAHAILDTGSPISVVPHTTIPLLRLSPKGMAALKGRKGCLIMYHVQIKIEQIGSFEAKVVADSIDKVILGRDVLGNFGTFIRKDGGIDLFKL